MSILDALLADPHHPCDLADELSSPGFARKHPHYFVRCDGRWGCHTAGLNEVPTDHYRNNGRAVTVDCCYVKWPSDRIVYVRTEEDAKRLVAALIAFNARSALRALYL